MLTVRELKEFLENIPDKAEVRVETEYSETRDCGLHHECTDIMYSDDGEQFVILIPDEQALIER